MHVVDLRCTVVLAASCRGKGFVGTVLTKRYFS